MQIRSSLLSIGFTLVFVPTVVIGIDSTTSGRILDTFKSEQRAILFENVPFDEKGMNEIYEKEYIMAGIEGLKSRIADTKKSYEVKKNAMTEQKTSLENTIILLENTIADTLSSIRKIESSIEEKNITIDEYESLSIDLSVKIKKNRATILAYMANIFSEGNILYNEDQQIDVFQSLILSSSDTDEIGRDIMYKSLVSQLGEQFINDYRALIKEYYLIEMRLKAEVTSLSLEGEKLDRAKVALVSQREYREKLLEVTKGKEELYAKYITAQSTLQEEVEKSWKNAEQSYTLTLDTLLEKNGCSKKKGIIENEEKCKGIESFYKNERALRKIAVSTGTTNIMQWPVSPTKGISSYYKDPSYYTLTRSQHEAIDVPASQGTDVVASMGGYIHYILPPVSGGYSYMAIKHPGGYFSVYGHLSEILVSPYQFVEAGEIIARSGGAPGTPGAGPMTTGPHLHFEVYKDTESIDPLRVLDLTRLAYDDLPSRYQDKFIADIIEKNGTGANISDYNRKFIIKGETEEARQKYLLRTYATPDFQNWDTWIDNALDARIDPSFLMCVGLAETTLGNYLKTSYNIGNVGNTDSGDVIYFSSPGAGIYAMANTFNNRFLSKYSKVSELSRWGNDTGTIYASSNANWHNNIIRCISSLKGRFVEDGYKFRVED